MTRITPTTDAERSRVMRAIKSINTKPEMKVRQLLHSLGYRYRLHRKELPGKPDIVFPSRKAVIFVNGCFWHGHNCKRGARIPKTNTQYWTAKISRNTQRDVQNIENLETDGWHVLVIWECEIKYITSVKSDILLFLDISQVK